MIKFLKFILFLVILAFAFALGVRFSETFKGNFGNLNDDEISVQENVEKSFNDVKDELDKNIEKEETIKDENTPLTEDEKRDVQNVENSEFVDINTDESINIDQQQEQQPNTQNDIEEIVVNIEGNDNDKVIVK